MKVSIIAARSLADGEHIKWLEWEQIRGLCRLGRALLIVDYTSIISY